MGAFFAFFASLIAAIQLLVPTESFVPQCNILPTTRTFGAKHCSRTFSSFLLRSSSSSSADMPDDPEEEHAHEKMTSTDALEFDALGMSPMILKAIPSDWQSPTPVQKLVIPEILSPSSSQQHRSLWCEAPTGSGKTGAYALPLMQLLMQQMKHQQGKGDPSDDDMSFYSSNSNSASISSLVLCPTRELAVQIGDVFRRMAQRMKYPLSVVTIYGGVPLEPQIAKLAEFQQQGRAVDVVVATPGRLVDVLTYYQNERSPEEAALERRLLAALDAKGKVDGSLSLQDILDDNLDRVDDEGRSSLLDGQLLNDLQYLVLDEADRLLGRGFEREMKNVTSLLPTDRVVSTWLFSATFAPQVEPRVASILKRLGHTEPLRLSCSTADAGAGEERSKSLEKKLRNASVLPAAVVVGPASTVNLRTIRLEERDRTQALRKLLEGEYKNTWDRVLVFVSTRYSSEHVSRKLRRVGISCSELHGKLDQNARLRRLQDFSKGKIRVLVATDLASRGLDVVGLPAVVNYDLPRSTSDFVHRIGRTARAGRRGTAVSFVTPVNEGHYNLIEKRHVQGKIEREVLPGFEPDEENWEVQVEAAKLALPGTTHSDKGLEHDKMFGGVKGRRRNKKDRLRQEAARKEKEKEVLVPEQQ